MRHLFEGFASAAAKILDCKKNLADERAGISSPKKGVNNKSCCARNNLNNSTKIMVFYEENPDAPN